MLVLYAGDDTIGDPQGSATFFERVPLADKAQHRYGGYYHEIFNEVNKEVVFQDLEAWLTPRL